MHIGLSLRVTSGQLAGRTEQGPSVRLGGFPSSNTTQRRVPAREELRLLHRLWRRATRRSSFPAPVVCDGLASTTSAQHLSYSTEYPFSLSRAGWRGLTNLLQAKGACKSQPLDTRHERCPNAH